MKKMAVSEAKTKFLATVDKVCATGETVVITKRGKPVAKLIPFKHDPDSIFGFMRGKGKIIGDIESPISPARDWKAMR
jgi:prevent-host-death family protein